MGCRQRLWWQGITLAALGTSDAVLGAGVGLVGELGD